MSDQESLESMSTAEMRRRFSMEAALIAKATGESRRRLRIEQEVVRTRQLRERTLVNLSHLHAAAEIHCALVRQMADERERARTKLRDPAAVDSLQLSEG